MSPKIHPPSLCPLGNGASVPSSLSAPKWGHQGQTGSHGPAGEAAGPESRGGLRSGLINAIWDTRKGLGTYTASGDASRARQEHRG